MTARAHLALLAAVTAAVLAGCGVPADGSDGVVAHHPAAASHAAPTAPAQLTETRPIGVVPVHVRIASVGIDAGVVSVGETPAGDVAVPGRWQQVGWFAPGYRPGQLGDAVLVGHLDTDDRAHPGAAFTALHRVAPGAEVVLAGNDGSELRFRVTATATYPVDAVPMARVFGPNTTPTLQLLTCAGTWRGPAAGYSERLVVTAQEETS